MSSIGVATGVTPTFHFLRKTARASGVKLSMNNAAPSSSTNESYSSMFEVSCPLRGAAGYDDCPDKDRLSTCSASKEKLEPGGPALERRALASALTFPPLPLLRPPFCRIAPVSLCLPLRPRLGRSYDLISLCLLFLTTTTTPSTMGESRERLS